MVPSDPPGVLRGPILGPNRGMFSKLIGISPLGFGGHSYTSFSIGRFFAQWNSFGGDVMTLFARFFYAWNSYLCSPRVFHCDLRMLEGPCSSPCMAGLGPWWLGLGVWWHARNTSDTSDHSRCQPQNARYAVVYMMKAKTFLSDMTWHSKKCYCHFWQTSSFQEIF